MKKYYFANGKEDVVTTWLNNSEYGILLVLGFEILMCGLIGG